MRNSNATADSSDSEAAPRRVRARCSATEVTPAPLVQVLAGNSVTGPAVLACLDTADTGPLRRLHPAVADMVAGVPWVDVVTPVFDVVRWRAALPAAVGARVDRLPWEPIKQPAVAAALVGVTHLELRGFGTIAIAAVLEHLASSLRVLNVREPLYAISGASFAHLAELVSLDFEADGDDIVATLPPSLQVLRLVHCGDHEPSTADYRHLVALRLLSWKSGELSSATVASLPPSLEELYVGKTRWPPGVSLAHLPRLLVFCSGYSDTIDTDTIESLPSCLLELEVPGCMASPSFAHWHALQTLDVCSSNCDDESLASLPPSLVTLDISWCENLTPTAVLPRLPALTALNVSYTEVGDAFVASLPPSLVTLSIVDCGCVTRDATLDHVPALQELHCSGTGLSFSAIAACRARGCVAPADGLLLCCGYGSVVTCLAVLPDGRLASGNSDGFVQLWDVGRQGEPELTMTTSVSAGTGGRRHVRAMAVLPDGCRLAVCVDDTSYNSYDSQSTVVGVIALTGDGGWEPPTTLVAG